MINQACLKQTLSDSCSRRVLRMVCIFSISWATVIGKTLLASFNYFIVHCSDSAESTAMNNDDLLPLSQNPNSHSDFFERMVLI